MALKNWQNLSVSVNDFINCHILDHYQVTSDQENPGKGQTTFVCYLFNYIYETFIGPVVEQPPSKS